MVYVLLFSLVSWVYGSFSVLLFGGCVLRARAVVLWKVAVVGVVFARRGPCFVVLW